MAGLRNYMKFSTLHITSWVPVTSWPSKMESCSRKIVCTPPKLYKRTLSNLHDSHIGIKNATSSNISHLVALNRCRYNYVQRCKICTKHKATQAVQPMLPRYAPNRSLHDLAADYFHFNSKEYLLLADTFSKFPYIYKTSSKTTDFIIQKLQQLISQYRLPKRLLSDNRPPFSLETLAKFLSSQHIDDITSSVLYPKSNGFIEWQIKTIKTALSTSKTSGTSIDHLLLNIRPTLIGPHMLSAWKILHNCTEECPGQPSQPIDFEEVCNYLIAKKVKQTDHQDCKHNAQPLSDLYPGQEVWVHRPTKPNSYIEGTKTAPTTTPHSYIIKAQGRTCHQTWQHTCPINSDIPSPSQGPTHQHQSCEADPLPEASDHQQQPPANSFQPSHIPELQCPGALNSHPAAYHPITTSCIPTLHYSPSLKSLTHPTALLFFQLLQTNVKNYGIINVVVDHPTCIWPHTTSNTAKQVHLSVKYPSKWTTATKHVHYIHVNTQFLLQSPTYFMIPHTKPLWLPPPMTFIKCDVKIFDLGQHPQEM